MTRPLFLSYYFPPIGGAGAQRPARFARYLCERGDLPAVVTGAGQTIDRWTPLDQTLLEEVPAQVEVRYATGEPPVTSRWRGRAERWLWLEPPWARWWIEESVARGLEIEGVDVIYTIMAPYVSAEAAFRLSRKLGKPWIADLGDPWALDEMMVYPSALHRRRELRRMRRLLATAAAIVTTTPEAAKRIRAEFPELAAIPVVSIPCGYDESDFAGPAPVRDDDMFRIVHTGFLHSDLGRHQRRRVVRLLGGSLPGVDIITRSHIYLLEAVERLLARDPDLSIEVHLAGVLSPNDRELAASSTVVRMPGYLSHHEAIGSIRSADLLFLPMQNLAPGMRSGIVPGKTYEYLASERPILAAVPEGDAREILLDSGTAHVCAPDDVEAMVEIIQQELSGTSTLPGPNRDLVGGFEYRHLTQRVAELIDRVRRPSAPRPAHAST
jgi:glycosyltransferase involved in cell wall biosynthesis